MRDQQAIHSRRDFLGRVGSGFGMVGFATATAFAGPMRPARADRVIFICLNGGLSQVDSFDPKPALDRYHGQPLPTGENPRTERKTGNLMRSPFTFAKHGASGIEVSELFPHIASVIDDFCVVRSMSTPIPNHEPSLLMMNCGHNLPGRPSLGSWLSYGLGSENQNLPAFMVLSPGQLSVVGAPLYGSAFLPPSHQGTFVSTLEADPQQALPYLRGTLTGKPQQRREHALARKLDRLQLAGRGQAAPELEAAITSMEVAFRMQTEARDVFDLQKETEATRRRYGDSAFARSCLLARRLVERGVRAVQVYFSKGNPWDHHDDILFHRQHARVADQPIAALIGDLKARGLLERTLVIVGSEFGRTPAVEVGQGGVGGVRAANGRDHNPYGYTMLLAGGGVKAGTVHGATDDFGFHAVKDVVEVHDLHATVLHQLGLDHEKLTYRFSGRDFRLTDVHGRVVRGLLT